MIGSIVGSIGGDAVGALTGVNFEDMLVEGMLQVAPFIMQTLAQPMLQELLAELGAEEE